MKSVMRSSMLLGSRTNVGKVTFERSMPTLRNGGFWPQWVRVEWWVCANLSVGRCEIGGGGCAPKLGNKG